MDGWMDWCDRGRRARGLRVQLNLPVPSAINPAPVKTSATTDKDAPSRRTVAC